MDLQYRTSLVDSRNSRQGRNWFDLYIDRSQWRGYFHYLNYVVDFAHLPGMAKG
jgi:hypothetical protein